MCFSLGTSPAATLATSFACLDGCGSSSKLHFHISRRAPFFRMSQVVHMRTPTGLCFLFCLCSISDKIFHALDGQGSPCSF
ncbi:hypothetical protein EV356DRAFT_215334 [Viridothelium virens]|uniref:Uncharacterized protein n=1 Tax=Viridothelium virens TaxID=1048519 RepID=A0A6A6H521_VIRVR|nr:hypothetical protein EV356DRAFT_215334 [Viridothelium virens]